MPLFIAYILFVTIVALGILGVSVMLSGQLGGGVALCAVALLLFVWVTLDEYGPLSMLRRRHTSESE